MKLDNLLIAWAQEDEERAVILHSSILNYLPVNPSDESWAHLEDALQRVRVYLPLDTVDDWRLLSDSELYGDRARHMLALADRYMDNTAWLLGDLYQISAPADHSGEGWQTPRLRPEHLFDGKFLFIASDLTAQKEFILHVPADKNLFVQYNTLWDGTRCCHQFIALADAKELLRKKNVYCTMEVKNPQALPCEAELLLLRPADGGWTQRRVRRDSLTPTGQGGSFSNIFRSADGDLYRLYKEPGSRGNSAAVTEVVYSKLRYLCRIKASGCLPNVALPKEIIRRADIALGTKECIGYTMDPLPGKPLSMFLGSPESLYQFFNGNAAAFANFYRSLARTLLELQMLHIYMNDLSFNNVLVDQKGNAYLVDTDSFALGWDSEHNAYGICGGDITPAFRHPEIGTGQGRRLLLQPKHSNFGFAILLYQMLVNADVANTLYRAGEGTTAQTYNWRDMIFPLEMNGPCVGARVSRQLLNNWMSVPELLRGMLADVLHHRRTLSHGVWVDLCDGV